MLCKLDGTVAHHTSKVKASSITCVTATIGAPEPIPSPLCLIVNLTITLAWAHSGDPSSIVNIGTRSICSTSSPTHIRRCNIGIYSEYLVISGTAVRLIWRTRLTCIFWISPFNPNAQRCIRLNISFGPRIFLGIGSRQIGIRANHIQRFACNDNSLFNHLNIAFISLGSPSLWRSHHRENYQHSNQSTHRQQKLSINFLLNMELHL